MLTFSFNPRGRRGVKGGGVSALPVQAAQARSTSPLTKTCQQFTIKAKGGGEEKKHEKFWTERQGAERETNSEVTFFFSFYT